MGLIIKDIKIAEESYSVLNLENDEEEEVLANLSKINIFVGENNSGKSRLLRSLLGSRLQFRPHNEDFYKINNNIQNLKNNVDTFFIPADFEKYQIPGSNLLDDITKKDFLEEQNKEQENYMDRIIGLKKTYETLKGKMDPAGYYNISDGIGRMSQTISYDEVGKRLITILEDTFNLGKPFEDVSLDYQFTKVYIPILRGIRPINYGESDESSDSPLFKKDVYKLRTVEDYFKESDNFFIFTGLETFDILFEYLNGKRDQRKIISRLKQIMAVFFNVEEIELISNPKDNGTITVKIGDEIENHIYNLGDGIQSVIIILLSLLIFQEKEENKNTLVFIEEPEHLLHPGFQRRLIEILLTYEEFSNFQFFLTSHSNHFLDITLDYDDVSIFTIKKEFDDVEEDDKIPHFLIENLSYGNNNALELLGVRNSSVFLSNCTIWIEGITDRYYIKKYFDLYQNYLKTSAKHHKIPFNQLREDYHYSYVEYAGNNITHWSFLDDENDLEEIEKISVQRLCGKVFLISDSDNARIIDEKNDGDIEANFSEKEIRFKKLKEILGNRFYLLESKEIENILSKNVLIEVIKDFEKSAGADEDHLLELNKLKEDEEFNESIYSNENLGEFIDEILKENKKRIASYKKGNTISEKQKFCQRALHHVNKYEDLSKEAISLCDVIYQFIAYNHDHDMKNYSEICEKSDIPHKLVKFDEIEEL